MLTQVFKNSPKIFEESLAMKLEDLMAECDQAFKKAENPAHEGPRISPTWLKQTFPCLHSWEGKNCPRNTYLKIGPTDLGDDLLFQAAELSC